MFFYDPMDWLDEPTEKIVRDEPKYAFNNSKCTLHLWKKYEGLRLVDYYCQYCGIKKTEEQIS